jgi:hypothetical protein
MVISDMPDQGQELGTAPWPLPEPSSIRWRIVVHWLVWLGHVALLMFADGAVDFPRRPRTVSRRWRHLLEGGQDWLDVAILGEVPWRPPSFDPRRPIHLTREGALTEVDGFESTIRPIPLSALDILALHGPGAAVDRLAGDVRPTDWMVEVIHQPTGKHSGFAGDLDDLALLAGVAGWAVPPNLPGGSTSGSRRS